MIERIATELSNIPPIVARVGPAGDDQSDYVLDSAVDQDGDRLAIVLQLRPAGQRAASWTATFWRRSLDDPD
ncbi:MAG: hypothetical protein ACREOK_09055, partial [Gemmatimonadaceae bacterium]